MKQPEAWTRYARALIATSHRPHFAPSEDILAIQRERVAAFVARHGAGCLAVILGATPELADLALASGCRVVRIDCNPAMFAAAAGRALVTDRSKEIVVAGDWLHLDMIADGEAGIVLGDSALNNVPHDDMARQIHELARITHCGSLLCLRQIVLPDQPVPAYEFAAALAAVRAARVTRDEFHRMLRFYSFVDRAYDPETCVLDGRAVFAEIRRRHEDGALTEAEFDFLIQRSSEIRHTLYPCSEQRRLLEALGTCETLAPALGGDPCGLFKVFAVTVRQTTGLVA